MNQKFMTLITWKSTKSESVAALWLMLWGNLQPWRHFSAVREPLLNLVHRLVPLQAPLLRRRKQCLEG